MIMLLHLHVDFSININKLRVKMLHTILTRWRVTMPITTTTMWLVTNRGYKKDGHASPWEDCAHINLIFGDLSGRELQNKIWDTYVVPRPVDAAIPYFMPDPTLGDAGEPIELFFSSVRHTTIAILKIRAKNTSDPFSNMVLGRAFVARHGQYLALYGVTPAMFWVVAGATLREAIYCAHKEDPSNPQVITTMQDGVHPITLFDARTPPVVLNYLVDAGNVQNGVASKTTFVQLYDRVKYSRIAFNLYREKENNKSRNVDGSQAGWGATRRQWIQNYTPFKSNTDHGNACSVSAGLTSFVVPQTSSTAMRVITIQFEW